MYYKVDAKAKRLNTIITDISKQHKKIPSTKSNA